MRGESVDRREKAIEEEEAAPPTLDNECRKDI